MEIQIVIGLIILGLQILLFLGSVHIIVNNPPIKDFMNKYDGVKKRSEIPIALNAEIIAKASVADKALNNTYMKYLARCDKNNRPNLKVSRKDFFNRFIEIAIKEKDAKALILMADAQEKYLKENPDA